MLYPEKMWFSTIDCIKRFNPSAANKNRKEESESHRLKPLHQNIFTYQFIDLIY
jgi:hypothetical protein